MDRINIWINNSNNSHNSNSNNKIINKNNKRIFQTKINLIPLNILTSSLNEEKEKEILNNSSLESTTITSTITNNNNNNNNNNNTRDENKVIQPNLSYGCRLCNLIFNNLQEHQQHYKTDLHLNNLKRSLNNNNNNDSGDDDNNDNDNNDNNNDENDNETTSDEDEENEANESIILSSDLTGTIIDYEEGKVQKTYSSQVGAQLTFYPKNSIWKFKISSVPLSFIESQENTNPWLTLSKTISFFHSNNMNNQNNENNSYICILLLRSGKFAGSIFNVSTGKSVIHKVFRRYTVRAKAGGSQSSHDNQGKKAQSMGAQLRRHGEQALQNDIYKLLLSWKDLINSCFSILISMSKTMRHYIFHNESQDRDYPLKTIDDSRIKLIPFQVGKPVYDEVCNVYEKCMTVNFEQIELTTTEEDNKECEDIEKNTINNEEKDGNNNNNNNNNNNKEITLLKKSNEEVVYEISDEMKELLKACQNNEIENVKLLLSSENIVEHLSLSDPISLETLTTLLHIVSENGYSKLVTLLLENGASPEKKDINQLRPYQLCKNKETRDAYRRFRSISEDLWDWNACGVPIALSDELIQQQKEKEKEKRKKLKQKKKDEKELKKVNEMKQQDNHNNNNNNNNNTKQSKKETPDEIISKQYLEMNLKAREAAGNCEYCKNSLFGIQSYEVFDKKCCSSSCVVSLRRKILAEAAEKRMSSKK